MLAPLTLLRPSTLEEAVRLAREPQARVIAGGTGLLPNLRRGIGGARTLVSLDAVHELRGLQVSSDGIRIGACVSVQKLADANEVPAALREAAQSVGASGHRYAATLGGNLCLDTRCVYYNQSEFWRRSNGYCLKLGGDTCHVAPQGRKCRAAYSGDLAAALLALNADVETNARSLALKDLYRDDGANFLALDSGEIVTAVGLRPPQGASGYAKARTRGSIDYPLAGVAMALALRDGHIAHLCVALTGTNSRPFVVEGTDKFAGEEPGEAIGTALTKLIQKQAAPMRTTLAAADYRRQAAALLARRLLARLAKGDSP